jgi:hypothetical protein
VGKEVGCKGRGISSGGWKGRGSCSRGGQEKGLQGLKKSKQRWARKEVARVEEVGAEVGKKVGCKG